MFKQLGTALKAYESPIMLISAENDIEDPIRRRLVSALHRFGEDVVEMRVPNDALDAEELIRCCNIAREEDVNTVLAFGEGIALEYARAVSTCAWSPSDPWKKYVTGAGAQTRKRIPFAHVFASLNRFDDWAQAFGGSGSAIEPEFAVQVTSAIY